MYYVVVFADDEDDYYELFTPNRGSVHDGRYSDNWMITEPDYIIFDVMASNDAHIGLMADPNSGDDIEYEVAIGSYGNQKVTLRTGIGQGQVDEVSAPDILKEDEFQTFWVSWKDGFIQAGFGGMVGDNFLVEYNDPDAPMVKTISFMTGWGTTGRWRLKRGMRKYE